MCKEKRNGRKRERKWTKINRKRKRNALRHVQRQKY